MPDWNRLKDRLGLRLAGLAPPALAFAVLTHFGFPAVKYLLLLALLWLPIVVHLLAKTDTPVSKEWAYCLYMVLILCVAGPSLPSQGIVGWVKSWGIVGWVKSWGIDFPSAAIFATTTITTLWIWQIKRGNGTKQTRKRIKHLPKDNDNELNLGDKYA